ncbi:MAG: anti-sigma factor [Chitinophagaceae bacterium]|nr:anti-sigma factor [Chitinophagaceae bacterium]
MNIQEYISSGIVESYVLGLADHEERADFDRMCAAHAEVRKARELFELSLEEQAMLNAVTPSKNIKSKIFAEIEIESEKINDQSFIDDDPLYVADGTRSEGPAKIKAMGWLRYLAAASIALLIISTALNFYLFNQYKSYSSRYATLMAQQTELAKNNDIMRTRLTAYEGTIAMLRDPDMAVIKMPGTNVPTSPDSSSVATVYWNTKSKDVYLLVNNLPQPPSDKQYQLWAIVDGQPVDAGVFDVQSVDGLLRMKNMPRAQIFAVTLEKRGGSVAPEGPMYVLGKVS